MLSRHRRLRAAEVKEILSRGRSIRGGTLSMKFLHTKEPFRFAAVVPKSLARSAVARNRLRRAAYDALPASALASRTGRALFFVRAAPRGPLRAIFKEEMSALLEKI